MTPFIRFILSSAFLASFFFVYLVFVCITIFFGIDYRDNLFFYIFLSSSIFVFLLLLTVLNFNKFDEIKTPKWLIIFFLLLWVVRKFIFIKTGFLGGFVLTGLYYYPLGIIFLPLLVLFFNKNSYGRNLYYFLLYNLILILEFILFIIFYQIKIFFSENAIVSTDSYLNIGLLKLIIYHIYYYFSFSIAVFLYLVFIFNFGERIKLMKFPESFFNLINMVGTIFGGFTFILLIMFG